MASPVEQNVSIMPILDLEEVADKTVARATLHEIPLGREELFGNGFPEFFQEIIEQRQLCILFDL